MRKELPLLIALCCLFVSTVRTETKTANECTAMKMAALSKLSPKNIKTMLVVHFDLNRLGGQIIGGQAKWHLKKNSAQRKAITELFSDGVCLGEIYKNLQEYKGAKVEKYKTTDSPRKSVVEVIAGEKKKTVTINYGDNCMIVQMCTEGSGCTHTAFRHYCDWEGK